MPILLSHTSNENTVCYFGTDIDDVLTLSERN
nr:integrase [Novosphingobium sp.]